MLPARAALALVFALTSPWSAAQGPAAAAPAPAPLAADDALFRALGGEARIRRFTDDFYERMLKDPRIARYFDGVNTNYLKRVLGDYFCVVAGGPCTYDGVSMKDAHAHLGIDRAAFNALVEHLQDAMHAADVPFGVQNQLLARVAFFHRDIITK
ncbi:MAG: group 1 truncated hemoglobin [Burkholderiales bacterium]|nr:MAG: group 1 truncated hemoglobin [Burkholderiales bacterium]